MGHLFLTVKYLLKDLKSNPENESTPLTIPPGVSAYDWKYNIKYLNKVVLNLSNGQADILSYVDKDFERLLKSPKKREKAFHHLREFFKILGSNIYDNWQFSEIDRGFINRDRPQQKIIFKKDSKIYEVAKELWRNRGKDEETGRLANRASIKNMISGDDVRKAIEAIKDRIGKAENKYGFNFPYQIVRPTRNRVGLYYK